jgi:hypothetical protein
MEILVPLELVCDNLSAIHLAEYPVHHGQVKHVAIKHHWICEHVHEGTFKMKHTYTSNMIADIFTKNLGKKPFFKFREMIGLSDTVQIEGGFRNPSPQHCAYRIRSVADTNTILTIIKLANLT